uniref:Apoptosis-antagonizing transcription factor, C-terminal n=1 Tax=Schistocephalus solidus TaxID=70667 RepID=A0A0V0J4G6_SCHSO
MRMNIDLDLSEAESIEADDVVIKYSDNQPVSDHEPIATERKTPAKKPKREVDVRASKGRKIRYLKIPKAVDFMFPVQINYFTEVQRNNILTQLKENMMS